MLIGVRQDIIQRTGFSILISAITVSYRTCWHLQFVAYSLFLSKLDIVSRFSNLTKSLDFVPKHFSAKIYNIAARHTMKVYFV